MYLHGVSTRRVIDITEQLCGVSAPAGRMPAEPQGLREAGGLAEPSPAKSMSLPLPPRHAFCAIGGTYRKHVGFLLSCH